MSTSSKKTFTEFMVPLKDFIRLESAGGIVLMLVSLVALVVANSPLSGLYESFLNLPFEIRLGGLHLDKPLLLWVNDGLMAIFFFLVGLELKREVVEGHLSNRRNAILPAFAAAGGMAGPAIIYAALNWSDPVALNGWAIPAATDIAFALGVLSLLGDRVPPALKVFLLSVAIFDDLGAIVIIALFYTANLSTAALVVALVMVAGLFVLNRTGVMKPTAYFLIAVPLWIAVLKSGVHATLAGVVVAMFIPIRSSSDDTSRSMLHHLEHALHPWVAFGVLPVFAFCNAGVPVLGLSPTDLLHPVPLGIAAGLLFGKLIGVTVMTWLATVVGRVPLPTGTNWPSIIGTALLCGIGFTMSLFIASLAFDQGGGEYFGLERLGILTGSLVAGLCGYLLLKTTLKGAAAE